MINHQKNCGAMKKLLISLLTLVLLAGTQGNSIAQVPAEGDLDQRVDIIMEDGQIFQSVGLYDIGNNRVVYEEEDVLKDLLIGDIKMIFTDEHIIYFDEDWDPQLFPKLQMPTEIETQLKEFEEIIEERAKEIVGQDPEKEWEEEEEEEEKDEEVIEKKEPEEEEEEKKEPEEEVTEEEDYVKFMVPGITNAPISLIQTHLRFGYQTPVD